MVSPPSCDVQDVASSKVATTGVQVPALHLLNAEITSVITALRRQQRTAASSGFLGGSSSTAFTAPPIGGGSTAASLTRAAIEAASMGLRAGSSALPAGTSASSSTNGLGASMGLRAAGSIITGDRSSRPLADGRDESIPSLLNGFTVLRAQLREQSDLNLFALPVLLSPFLRVILSPRVTGPVTSAALQSLHRLLVYGIVRASSGTPNVASSSEDPLASQQAIAEIAHAVSHCRFEASDAVADELVLLRILAVMRQLVCADGTEGGASNATLAPLADQLGDESICAMMETGLSMCCQMRLSDLLRRTAEQSTIAMARMLFAKLAIIPTSVDEAYSADPNVPPAEPEHATLAAEPVGEAANVEAEKRLRRMSMPDPKSSAVPAAAAMAELKAIGEAGEEEQADEPKAQSGTADTERTQAEQTGESKKSPLLSTTATVSEAEAALAEQLDSSAPYEVIPYGLPAIKEVLRVVISLLDPHNVQHTDTMRLLGLAMLCSIFEVSSKSIGRFPSLRAMVQDSACKYLFQLARSEHPLILSLALRATATLFETMREHLKLQYELFLNFLLDRLAPTFPIVLEPWNDEILSALGERRAHLTDGPNTRAATPEPGSAPPPPPPPPPPMPRSSDRAPATGEARELMLETLGLLLRTHDAHAGLQEYDVMVELWANFDCDIDCENMFERFVQFLCRSIYASHPQHAGAQDSTQLFALDVLLTLIAAMTERQETSELDAQQQQQHSLPLSIAESLSAAKSHKAGILAGAAKFNEKPKTGLTYLEEQGLIDTSGQHDVSRAMSIAKFLKDCPRLDKKLLGDYISRPDNIEMLEAFISLFDFRERPVAEAMRDMLESFRLPGESQQINRITETFAKAYFASGQPEVASEDAVYVLAYSIIMLNTDLHNPNIKRHMSIEDYCRNLRGVNDGKDFNQEFLISIYDSIRRREIVMPEEHVGQLGFEYAWKEILRRSRKAGPLLAPTTAHFDRAMFESSWRPIVASIAHAFSSFRDEHLLERAISGFRQCAILASRFGMIELFDYMVQGLAGATGLLDASVPGAGALTNNANVEVDGQTITVSPLSVRFGSNFKGQLAAVVLFTIANGNGDAIRAGWAPVFEIFKNLFTNSLLPAPLSHMRDFSQGTNEENVVIPLKPRKPPGPPPQDPRAQGGLFSTLSSYLLSPYQATQEPAAPDVTPEDVESSLCTVDCVASCKIDELYSQVLQLNGEALLSALQALKNLVDRLTFARLATSGSSHEQHRLVQQRDEATSSGRSTPVPSSTPGQGGSQLLARGQQLPYDPSAIFVLEMLTSVACSADEGSIAEAWSIASTHITSILHGVRSFHPLHVERAVASLLRLAQKASPLAEGPLRDQIFVALDLLRTVPNELKAAISAQLIGGVAHIIRDDPGFARSQTEWSLVLALVSDHAHSRNAHAAAIASDAARQIAVERLTRDNFLAVVNLLKSFASGADTSAWKADEQRQSQRRTLTEKKELADFEVACQARGLEAIAVLEGIKSDVPRIAEASGLTLDEAWTQLWLPLMSALALQCTNGYRPVRQAAVTHLQRTLLAPEVLSGHSGSPAGRGTLPQLFTSVLFPTLDELLKPEVYQKDAETGPGGMQETRMRTCALLCKIYLHYLTQLSEGASDEAFQELWLRILDYFDRLMHASKKDQLTEAIQENLKNVLLVMNASRLLLPPVSSREPDERTTPQAKLWLITFERVGRFLPKLQEDLFPPPTAPPSDAPPSQKAPTAIPYPPVEEDERAGVAEVSAEGDAEEIETVTE